MEAREGEEELSHVFNLHAQTDFHKVLIAGCALSTLWETHP